MRYCKCGCNQIITSKTAQYIRGHSPGPLISIIIICVFLVVALIMMVIGIRKDIVAKKINKDFL